jgi:hypothetical protein
MCKRPRARKTFVPVAIGGTGTTGFVGLVTSYNASSYSTTADLTAPNDLISFIKTISIGRYRREVHNRQWFLLLQFVVGILGDSRSSRDLEANCQKVPARAKRGIRPGLKV